MKEHFVAGGWPMYPILLSGVCLLAAAILYARQPGPKNRPLLMSLGLVTLLWGVLGTTLGLIHSLDGLGQVPPGQIYLVLIGLGESLNNLSQALIWLVLAAMVKTVGDLGQRSG